MSGWVAFENVPAALDPPALSLSVVREHVSFVMLKDAWEDLFRRAMVQTPFLHYSWAQLRWDRQRADRDKQLSLIVVRNGARVVLIAPFVAHRRATLFFATCFFWVLSRRSTMTYLSKIHLTPASTSTIFAGHYAKCTACDDCD